MPIRPLHRTLLALATLAAALTGSMVQAQGADTEPAPAAGAALPEEVVFVPMATAAGDVALETTVYRPAGSGPWPLVVVNHGSRGLPDPHQQPRFQPVETARFFLERGYLVVAPMREGFSRSGGRFEPSQCQQERYARRYGPDIAAVIEHFVQRGLARADQVLVTGQSNGGLVTLGWAAQQPRARAFINFAGGNNTTYRQCDWAAAMVEAARALGAQTRIPSLWIYTEDDAIFPPAVSRPFFEAYRDAGAPATYSLYAKGGHPFSHTRHGRQTWGPEVQRFLQSVGLPSEPLPVR